MFHCNINYVQQIDSIQSDKNASHRENLHLSVLHADNNVYKRAAIQNGICAGLLRGFVFDRYLRRNHRPINKEGPHNHHFPFYFYHALRLI